MNTRAPNKPVNLYDKLDLIARKWSPRIVAAMNDYHFKIAKIEGDFIWHRHEHTDEVFIVLHGEMEIALRDGPVRLAAGELYVVPRGVEHKPCAARECHILMVEPAGTINTGDAGGAGGDRTVTDDIWI